MKVSLTKACTTTKCLPGFQPGQLDSLRSSLQPLLRLPAVVLGLGNKLSGQPGRGLPSSPNSTGAPDVVKGPWEAQTPKGAARGVAIAAGLGIAVQGGVEWGRGRRSRYQPPMQTHPCSNQEVKMSVSRHCSGYPGDRECQGVFLE